MATARRIAPIFPVRDLDAALAFYQRLGFSVRPYSGGGYGFASRDGLELHLGVVPADRAPLRRGVLVRRRFRRDGRRRAAGVEVNAPQDTEWGQHEGAVVDPDGNVIRFGSPAGRG